MPSQPHNPAAIPASPSEQHPSPGNTAIHTTTPENKQGHINPSAPNDANLTPGSAGEK